MIVMNNMLISSSALEKIKKIKDIDVKIISKSNFDTSLLVDRGSWNTFNKVNFDGVKKQRKEVIYKVSVIVNRNVNDISEIEELNDLFLDNGLSYE